MKQAALCPPAPALPPITGASYFSFRRFPGIISTAILFVVMRLRHFMNDSEYVLVRIAAEKSGYSTNHIRKLIRDQQVAARNIGIWLVHLPSLLEYKAEMDELGSSKFDPTKSLSLDK